MGEITKLDEFVELYESLGIDFEHIELPNSQFLIFKEDERLVINSPATPHLKFDTSGNFMEQIL